MTESVISEISPIKQDEHGYYYVDLVLENGAQGFFPNKEEVLGLFYKGCKVKYRDIYPFNGRDKILGLLKIKDEKMKISKILKIEPYQISEKNGSFYTNVTLEDSSSAIVIEEDLSKILALKKGTVVSYQDVADKGDKGMFFIDLGKVPVNTELKRTESIIRQVAFKAAVDLISNKIHPIPKGVDVVEATQILTEEFFAILNVD